MPKLSEIILKRRISIILCLIGLLFIMIYFAKQSKLSYDIVKILPFDNQINIDYENFKIEFGESINTMVIAVEDLEFFTKQHLSAWHKFGKDIENLEGVNGVLNITKLPILSLDSTGQKFISKNWYSTDLNLSELELSIKNLRDQKIYEGMFYNNDVYAGIMLVDIDKEVLSNSNRKNFIDRILLAGDKYSKIIGKDVRYSGMPYIRTIDSLKVKDEIYIFIILTLLITSIILFIFFRSLKSSVISILVVVFGVIFFFGFLTILDYKITILTALVPPLIIVIGIPNCIYLINKYHTEFKKNRNKQISLGLMISKIGNITLLTNLTTASGFAAFTLTKSETLQEFGLAASISIVTIFCLSLLMIPIWFSFFPEPSKKHTKHLDKKWVRNFVGYLIILVRHKRRMIYTVSIFLIILGVVGLKLIKTTGNITDDLSKHGKLYEDFMFFEQNFGGVMPLEIIIETNDTNGIRNPSFMTKLNKLQFHLESYEEFSKPISFIEFVKYANQVYKDQDSRYYTLPQRKDFGRISSMIRKSKEINSLQLNLTDTIYSKARISLRMRDLATPQMDAVIGQLQPKIDSIFSEDDYNIIITGSSRVFLEGTKFLVSNLSISLLIVIFLISIFMAWMFRSYKMVLISIIPNLLPLLLTSAIMGYFSIPIKPSTILVFSIAFGISVDDTIHFLAKYRQELIANNWNIRKSVFNALEETGVSMIYTSIVLFFGFLVFIASDFGGTVALGSLISITLFFAMLSNLLLLPALLLSLEKLITTKSFKKPLINIFDEDK